MAVWYALEILPSADERTVFIAKVLRMVAVAVVVVRATQ